MTSFYSKGESSVTRIVYSLKNAVHTSLFSASSLQEKANVFM